MQNGFFQHSSLFNNPEFSLHYHVDGLLLARHETTGEFFVLLGDEWETLDNACESLNATHENFDVDGLEFFHDDF